MRGMAQLNTLWWCLFFLVSMFVVYRLGYIAGFSAAEDAMCDLQAIAHLLEGVCP